MFPTKQKITPCVLAFINDHPNWCILANGKVSNGKRGFKKQIIKSVYDLAITLYKDGFIVRQRGEYIFVKEWHGLKYPYYNKITKRGQIMKKKKEKTYLCQEGKENFTVKASSLKEAQEHAEIYNGVAIREIKEVK